MTDEQLRIFRALDGCLRGALENHFALTRTLQADHERLLAENEELKKRIEDLEDQAWEKSH